MTRKQHRQSQKEIDMMKNYDYVVENDEVDAAVKRIQAIVTAEHLKRERLMDKYKRLVEVE